MTSPSLALRHLRRALSRWPTDTLRPDFPFARTLLAAKQARLAPAAPPASPSPGSAAAAAPPPAAAADADAAAELDQANALYSLLENRYARLYAAPPRITRPPGAPEHYARLLREIDEAPARGALGRAWGRMSRMVRWK